ncbi:MAG: hypothetical protein KDD64_12215 [Bdellovibrionales bacterium]|nr:hypothetical protein [Bdellovibrionales bacterium]
MSLITHVLVDTFIDFPHPKARLVVEDNVGDHFPIHIHIGTVTEKGMNWIFRWHFTYDEFEGFSSSLLRSGRLPVGGETNRMIQN